MVVNHQGQISNFLNASARIDVCDHFRLIDMSLTGHCCFKMVMYALWNKFIMRILCISTCTCNGYGYVSNIQYIQDSYFAAA